MRYCSLQLRERGKMTDNRKFVPDFAGHDWAQLKALSIVMDEILGNKLPIGGIRGDAFTKKVIKELEEQRYNYLIDDGDLCSVIDMAIVELRSARAMLTQMRDELQKQDTKIAEQYSEIQRLERLVANAN